MNVSILRLARVILVSYVGIAVALVFWQMVQAPVMVAREDNPRLVLAQQRIHRGRLLDAHGVVLAQSLPDPESGFYVRNYPAVEAVHGVGYYSLRYGAGAAEAAFDRPLRGELSYFDHVLHRTQKGNDVPLSLDLAAQTAASRTLGDRRGAVVVIEVTTGRVLVLLSHPLFDPNVLDEQWDTLSADPAAPLLNRATQGSYPLGDMARWVALTGLMSAGTGSPAGIPTASLETLLGPLGEEGFVATYRQLGFGSQVPFELENSEGRLPPFDDKTSVRDVAVAPIHVARWLAAVARDGRLLSLTVAGSSSGGESTVGFAPWVAAELREHAEPYGDMAGWSGTVSPQETGSNSLCWLGTYGPVAEPRYAVAVVVESCSHPGVVALPVAQAAVSELGD